MDTQQNANVAFVINRNYIGQFKVTLYSLAKSNGDMTFSVHLLHNDLSEEDKADLERFVASLRAEIFFYPIDDSPFEGLPKMGYDQSYTAYYKVLLPYYLNELSKVLYLDCDIIVRGSIRELFEMQTGAFLSCVEDYKISRKRKEHVARINGNENIKYFNSGVMLFDFSKAESIAERDAVIGYISENRDIIRWHDQDILNHFYAADCYFLPDKYNYLTTYRSIADAVFAKGKKAAVIVHYANWKPWNANYIGKYYRLYKTHYRKLRGEKGVEFLHGRNPFAQLKLIFKYLFKR